MRPVGACGGLTIPANDGQRCNGFGSRQRVWVGVRLCRGGCCKGSISALRCVRDVCVKNMAGAEMALSKTQIAHNNSDKQQPQNKNKGSKESPRTIFLRM